MASTDVILVTGCSSGIGLELARLLRNTTFRVVLTARTSSLATLAKEGFADSERMIIRPLDVGNAREREGLFEEIGWRWGGVDILVNNAGISYRAVVEHMTEDEEFHQMQTNYLGPMALTRLALPWMRSNRYGKIISVSSVSGMMAMPTMSSYSSSKFALEGAMESLWYELQPWNIAVSLVQPGFIRSDSFLNVYYSRRAAACDLQNDEYCRYYTAMEPFIERLMRLSPTSARDVAKQILKLIRANSLPLRKPATWDAQIFYWIRRLLPRRIYHRVLYWSLPSAKHWSKATNTPHPKPDPRSHSNDDAI